MIVIVDEMKKFRELLDQNGIEWVDDSEEERDDDIIGHCKAEEAYKLVEIIEWSEKANNEKDI